MTSFHPGLFVVVAMVYCVASVAALRKVIVSCQLSAVAAKAGGVYVQARPIRGVSTEGAGLGAAWERVATASDVPCEADASADATSEDLLPLGVLRSEDGGRANLDAWGDFLVAGHGGDLDIVGVHDPMAPRVVATFAHEDGFWDARFLGDGRFVAAAHGRSIEIVDVSAATVAAAGSEIDPDGLASVGLWEYFTDPENAVTPVGFGCLVAGDRALTSA